MEREREREVIGESASSWINSLRFVNYYRPPRLVDIGVYIYIYTTGGGGGGWLEREEDTEGEQKRRPIVSKVQISPFAAINLRTRL